MFLFNQSTNTSQYPYININLDCKGPKIMARRCRYSNACRKLGKTRLYIYRRHWYRCIPCSLCTRKCYFTWELNTVLLMQVPLYHKLCTYVQYVVISAMYGPTVGSCLPLLLRMSTVLRYLTPLFLAVTCHLVSSMLFLVYMEPT